MTKQDDEHFMARAIALSRRALDEPGLRPFGAVVVRDGRIVGEGVNAQNGKHDPTSHGEVEAIRAACAALATTDLGGCTLYTSCEPCAMCTATMHLAGISRVVYAASAEDSARAFAAHGRRAGAWPAAALRAQIARPIDARAMPAVQLGRDEALAVIDAFAAGRG
jgi:tRNA(Arg) A34 adenosine deaminase TadA